MDPSGRRLRNNSRTESHLLRIINFDGGLPVWWEVSEQASLAAWPSSTPSCGTASGYPPRSKSF